MARLNTAQPKTGTKSPLKATYSATARTHEGGAAYVSDEKTELFRLGVNLLAGEGTYYESGKNRNSRFTNLVQKIAVEDPQWISGFLGWLRSEGNIRTASVMGAVDAVNARLKAGITDAPNGERGINRSLIGSVIQRADELGEVLAYQRSTYGKAIPKPVKRGVSDAAGRLLNEYGYMKWDSDNRDWRVSDVLEMVHAKPAKPYQEQLYALAIANRHGNDFEYDPNVLRTIEANKKLREAAANDPKLLLDPNFIREAGFTWEDALSLAGNKVDKGKLWDAVILSGNLGHMAALRNLRNMQMAGISAEATEAVIHIISDEDRVLKGRQFPYRYWSAYKEARGTQWAHPLEIALQTSVRNIPELSGRTLVLVDTSGSMAATVSDKSKLRCDEAGAVFGAALAAKNAGKVDLYMFASTHRKVNFRKGDSVMRITEDIVRQNGAVGYGTETVPTIRATFNDHDRVMIITDGQSFGSHYGRIEDQVTKNTWLYAWNLGGYKNTDIPSGESRRHQLGGLTDGTFKLVPLLERGKDAAWPWEA